MPIKIIEYPQENISGIGATALAGPKGDKGAAIGEIEIAACTLPANGSVTTNTIPAGVISDGDLIYGVVQGINCFLSRVGSTVTLKRYLPASGSTSILANAKFRATSFLPQAFPLAADATLPTGIGGVTVTIDLPTVLMPPVGTAFPVSVRGISGTLTRQAAAATFLFTPTTSQTSSTSLVASVNFFVLLAGFPTNPFGVGLEQLEDTDYGDVVAAILGANGRSPFYIRSDGTVYIKKAALGSILNEQGTSDYFPVPTQLQVGSDFIQSQEYDGILWAWLTNNGSAPLYIKDDLTVVIPKLQTNLSLKTLSSPALGATDIYGVKLDGSGNRQIFKNNIVTGRAVQLTSSTGENFNPSIIQTSPEKIAFTSTRKGTEQYWWADADGGNQSLLISSEEITCWGDSLAGTGGYTDSLPSLMPTRTINNRGIGGQDIDMIAARQGAQAVTFNVTGASIPASGAVALDAGSIDILYNSPGGLYGTLGGVAGTLTRSSQASTPYTYTFTRETAGTAVPVTNPVRFFPDAIYTLAQTCVIINDHGMFQYQSKVAQIQAMIDYLKPRVKHYLVLGHLYETPHIPGNANRTAVDNLNATLASTFGDHYLDLNAYLIQKQKDYFNAGDARFTFPALTGTIADGSTISMPSASDQIFTNQIPCLCPTSGAFSYLTHGFRRDQVHFNTAIGNPEIAAYIKTQLEARGY